MTSSSLHGKLDPREAVLERFDLAASSKVAIKQLKNHLIEDLYTPQANVALRLARDSYNRRCPMHLVLDVSKYNSRGQLWLASVEATSSPALLEAHVTGRSSELLDAIWLEVKCDLSSGTALTGWLYIQPSAVNGRKRWPASLFSSSRTFVVITK